MRLTTQQFSFLTVAIIVALYIFFRDPSAKWCEDSPAANLNACLSSASTGAEANYCVDQYSYPAYKCCETSVKQGKYSDVSLESRALQKCESTFLRLR